MMDDDEGEALALVPAAERVAANTSTMIFDWRGLQCRLWEIDDLLRRQWIENVAPAVQIAYDMIYPTGPYSTHVRNRQRIAAAKRRARIITRAKGTKERRRE